jgi:hypothetical protein
MVARHKYRNDDGDLVYVPTVLRWGYNVGGQANEGQSPRVDVVVDDPDMTLDFVGHRRWIVYEDESDDASEIIFDGITQAVRIAHTGGEIENPDGRVWVIEINDLNTLWTYRVMTGADSQFDEQTDVERMQQLADSEEMGYFDDLTLISTDDPVTMDAFNGRGQTTGQIADTCAQESGKNYWISSTGTSGEIGADIFLWYGSDGLPDYTSPLSLSNDPADLDMPAVNDGTAIVYPLGKDTELRRDYARQYSGAYGSFQGGAKYIPDTENPYAPNITLSGRDINYPAPEITSRARMKSRLLRVLRDHATPDEVIKTTITLHANKASQLRHGMRIAVKATHEPGYEEFRYLRIMSATPKPVGQRYEIALELQGPGESEPIGDEVVLHACNTVLEDAERNGNDTVTDIPVEAGQVWSYTITNPQHASACWTDSLALDYNVSGATYIRAWGGNFGFSAPIGFPADEPWTPYSQFPGPPHPEMPEQTGTFIIAATGDALFRLRAQANYSPGTIDVDECWHAVLQRIG